jgi:hypothetical protein
MQHIDGETINIIKAFVGKSNKNRPFGDLEIN